ncbi:MAG TPA: PEP-CTERM sorting domain-containing protein [Phycisphaerae bacterium]|nr:PEP-CTERM sorting domain-containing protein [Phycisphaerae bacterium]
MAILSGLAAVGSTLLCSSFASAQQVNPGYDLFQTLTGTQFMGSPFDGVPLGNYAFPNPGNSPNPITYNTGDADTIVQRMDTATPGSPTVGLQMNALQLVSDTPISFGGGPLGFYYVTLQSSDGTGPVTTGGMTINFNTPTSGTFNSFFDIFFDVHFAALNGPIVYQSDLLLTNSGAEWSNLPAVGDLLLPNALPNTYNYLLNGSDNSNDFFITSPGSGPGGVSAGIITEIGPQYGNDVHVVQDAQVKTPEPGSLALLAVGAVGMMLRGRKKNI